MRKDKDNIFLIIVYLFIGVSKWQLSFLTIAQIFLLLCIIRGFFKGYLYKLIPLFIFFPTSHLYFIGIEIADIFCVVYILYFIKKYHKIKLFFYQIVPYIYILYLMTVVIEYSVTGAIKASIGFLFLVLALQELYKEKYFEGFCKSYILAIFSATIYGINVYIDIIENTLWEKPRYLLSFIDPNYAGLFLTVGIVILIFRKEMFSKLEWYLGFIVCIISIALTLSSTAMICNICLVIVWLPHILRKNLYKVIKILKYFLFLVLFLGLIFPILVNKIPSLLVIFERFTEKILMFVGGNISSATTGRSDLWIKNLDFFFNKNSFIHQVIGGQYLTDIGFDKRYFNMVSHQFYIDSLICFGYIGLFIIVGVEINELFVKWKNKNKSDINGLIFTMNLIWFLYSFGLSMFPSWIFSLIWLVKVENKKRGMR